jgi:hypothetical protein
MGKSKSKKQSKVERLEQEEYDDFLESSIKSKQNDDDFEDWTKLRDRAVEKEIERDKENDPKHDIFKKPTEPLLPSRSYLRKKDDKNLKLQKHQDEQKA